ncbi:MAG: TetR/AcrR family transcriptional regulator [Sphingobium sp.]
MTQAGRAGPMSMREAAKAERRDRIVRAAIALSREAGINGFSMRELAKAADVSHATPFNLFGSKAEVIAHIFAADLETFRDALDAYPSVDALERLFDMILLATEYFRRNSGLYRALHNSFFEAATAVIHQRFTDSRLALFVDLVAAAQADKFVRADLNCTYMALQLYNQWEALTHQWARGSITLERVEKEVRFGFAALLCGFSTASSRHRLSVRMMAHQADLMALDDAAPA